MAKEENACLACSECNRQSKVFFGDGWHGVSKAIADAGWFVPSIWGKRAWCPDHAALGFSVVMKEEGEKLVEAREALSRERRIRGVWRDMLKGIADNINKAIKDEA